MTWKIEYELSAPITVDVPIPGYPNLDIALDYDPNLKLAKIEHKITAAAELPPDLVMQKSERELEPLLEILEFFHGSPIQISARNARKLSADKDVDLNLTTIRTITGRARIAGIVRLPNEETLAGLPSRFATRLYLFNRARLPTSDPEAIRLYYLIWEDLCGAPNEKGDATPELRLKYSRDFVSHGVVLDRNQCAVKFITSHIKNPLTAFDPKDSDHCAFVARQRAEALSLIEPKLRNLLL